MNIPRVWFYGSRWELPLASVTRARVYKGSNRPPATAILVCTTDGLQVLILVSELPHLAGLLQGLLGPKAGLLPAPLGEATLVYCPVSDRDVARATLFAGSSLQCQLH